MEIDAKTQAHISEMIHSESSPVGIDAKKTHVIIIHLLQQIESRLTRLEAEVAQMATGTSKATAN